MPIIKSGNAGLVTTTGGGADDLVHTTYIDPVTGVSRSIIIQKIMAYNPAGNTTLIFGTRTNAGVFVAIFPTLVAIGGLDNEWTEVEIPRIEIQRNTAAGAAGLDGNLYVQDAGAGGVLLQVELAEITVSRGKK